MKQLPRDEIGYINNRGRSKYWGVTVNVEGDWVLSYHPHDSDMTHSAQPYGFKMKEAEVANIAAKIYENGQRRKFVERDLRVLSLDKKWVFTVRNNDIFRERYNSQVVTKNAPNLSLFDVQLQEHKVEHQNLDVVKKAVNSDNEYFVKLSSMILEGNLSERSTKALIAILESTLK